MQTEDDKGRNDQRKRVTLRAQIVDSSGSRSADVSDFSSRGVLGTMANPPVRGEFISLRLPSGEVAGQVRWVSGQKFGVRLRDNVDNGLLSARPRAAHNARGQAAGTKVRKKPAKITRPTFGTIGIAAFFAACLTAAYLIA